MYEWHLKKFLEICAREKLLFMCKANTADEVLRVLLLGSACFSVLVSVWAQEWKKTVLCLKWELNLGPIRINVRYFHVLRGHWAQLNIVSNENEGNWYTLQCKKRNSEIREVRDAAMGQVTFLKVILNIGKCPGLFWACSRKEIGNLTGFQHYYYETHNHWAAVLYLHLALKSVASISDSKKGSGS